MKPLAIGIFIIAVVILGIVAVRSIPRTQAPAPEATSTSATMDGGDMLLLDTPLSGANIVSPVHIAGRARGTMFFEAQFPVSLIDANGKELIRGVARAGGDWMTTDFVPFSATLAFSVPHSVTSGFLVFENDNPSGDSSRTIRIPVPVAFGAVPVGIAPFESGVRGTVLAGPQCAVQPVPEADNGQCAPRPLAIVVQALRSGTLFASAETDAMGIFKMALPPGVYTIHAAIEGIYPRCPSFDVTVGAKGYASADIMCDTGIR